LLQLKRAQVCVRACWIRFGLPVWVRDLSITPRQAG
jgi:hypothetical protein